MATRATGDPEIRNFLKRKQPLTADGPMKPTDVAGAVEFLLSDRAAFLTGQTLTVDAGWSLSGPEYEDGA
jgi:NAD(P)-dependent dehydrogenase (short-subunit alcohol dehydrogenase family)